MWSKYIEQSYIGQSCYKRVQTMYPLIWDNYSSSNQRSLANDFFTLKHDKTPLTYSEKFFNCSKTVWSNLWKFSKCFVVVNHFIFKMAICKKCPLNSLNWPISSCPRFSTMEGKNCNTKSNGWKLSHCVGHILSLLAPQLVFVWFMNAEKLRNMWWPSLLSTPD